MKRSGALGILAEHGTAELLRARQVPAVDILDRGYQRFLHVKHLSFRILVGGKPLLSLRRVKVYFVVKFRRSKWPDTEVKSWESSLVNRDELEGWATKAFGRRPLPKRDQRSNRSAVSVVN